MTLLLLALGLSADATAASIAAGLGASRVRVRDALALALSFGTAQALMPVIGWALGSRFASQIEAWDHWLVLVVLGGLGGKMIFDAMKSPGPKLVDQEEASQFALRSIVLMAIVTSLDALAAGVTLPLLNVPIVTAAAVIGAVTAVLCFLGAMLGSRLGARFGRRVDAVGGVLLIGLGIKTVLEHAAGR